MRNKNKIISLTIVSSLCSLVAPVAADHANELPDHVDPFIQQVTNRDAGVQEDLDFLLAELERKRLSLSRSTQINPDHLKGQEDQFLEGYIQAMIDMNYYEFQVVVLVQDRKVTLYRLPSEERLKNSIIAFVSDIPDVEAVEEKTLTPEVEKELEAKKVKITRINGVWFPESTVLFQPLIANPRDPIYSIGYRHGDNALNANQIISISFGDIFPIFRWYNVGPMNGALQIDISAGVWGAFDISPEATPDGEWAELITTDYILAIPITYAFDKWAFRFRVYHISSHLGDEYMVNHPTVKRLNPSFEAIELFSSYQATEEVRLYFGPGFVVNSDPSYRLKPVYLEYGTEIRLMKFQHHYHRLYGSPFFALDVQNWQETHFQFNVTTQLGYEWSKLQGAGRKVRLFGEYHNGFSEGQFWKDRTSYWTIRASWGF